MFRCLVVETVYQIIKLSHYQISLLVFGAEKGEKEVNTELDSVKTLHSLFITLKKYKDGKSGRTANRQQLTANLLHHFQAFNTTVSVKNRNVINPI